MSEHPSDIHDRVLKFYADLPFNAYSTPEGATQHITSHNQIAYIYADLDKILSAGSHPVSSHSANLLSVLDVGCGVGWFTNTVAYYYHLPVLGIDFNSLAIESARATAAKLGLNSAQFRVCNLFKIGTLEQRFDVVSSIGVLHHTADPLGGIAAMASVLSETPNARLYIGLYHLYGRRPFLNYFDNLKRSGKSEEDLFESYRELHSDLADNEHVRSWFRDQVLHPHESQHTLKEIAEFLNGIGFSVESTSINKYKKIENLEALFESEKDYEAVSHQRNVVEKKYFPGFFTVCAKRKN